MIDHICQINQLRKTYPLSHGVQHIFNQLQIQLNMDEITVFLGKSGCGKTTLLRLMAGLEHAEHGSITYFRDKVAYTPRIGMVFQESRLMPWMTVSENIMIHHNQPDPVLLAEMLQLVGLQGYEHSYPEQLSGGMAHRVSIARALAYQPHILMMDEPFAALDYFTRMNLQDAIVAIHRQMGKGIVFVTHNVDEALLIASKIVVLEKGTQPKQISIDRSYPRELSDKTLVKIKHEILQQLK